MAQSDTNKPVAQIQFDNGRQTRLVRTALDAKPAEIVAQLGLERPRAILVLIGGTSQLELELDGRLRQLFSRGLVRAAVDAGALIIDGGSRAGVIELMGQAVADRAYPVPQLGVAPAALATYPGGPETDADDSAPLDPNHSHFVLVDSDRWGGETDMLFGLAQAWPGLPSVTVLANGGEIAQDEVLRSVRRGWPVLVLEGSGRLADELAQLRGTDANTIKDPVLAEIVAEGDLHFFALDGEPAALREDMRRLFQGDGGALRWAWETFALYDSNAVGQQRYLKRLQNSILILGVLGTLLAVGQTQLKFGGFLTGDDGDLAGKGLHWLIVAVPVVTAVLVAVLNRFKTGNQWIALRSTAEAIKQEIYLYRTGAGEYRTGVETPATHLAAEVEKITRSIMQDEADVSALTPYDTEKDGLPPRYSTHSEDQGFAYLTPENYLRLGHNSGRFEKRLKPDAQIQAVLKAIP